MTNQSSILTQPTLGPTQTAFSPSPFLATGTQPNSNPVASGLKYASAPPLNYDSSPWGSWLDNQYKDRQIGFMDKQMDWMDQQETMQIWGGITQNVQMAIAAYAQWRMMEYQDKMADLQENVANHKMALEDKVADAKEAIEKIKLNNDLEAKKIEKRAEVEIAKNAQAEKTKRARSRDLGDQFHGRREPYYGSPLYS